MINMTTALYLGRFQPFHLGHLSVVKSISKKYDKTVIAICSAQHSHTKRNPFTYGERLKMIEDTLKDENVSNYRIIPIPDIDCPKRWAEFCHAIFGDYDEVITNNSNTRKLFEDRGDKVKGVPIYQLEYETHFRYIGNPGWFKISGTFVRTRIRLDDGVWKVVPSKVRHYLFKIKAHNRLKNI